MRLRARRGLDIRLPGAPRQEICAGPSVATVAVLGDDHRLRRPAPLVAVGDRVRLGQAIIEDRRAAGVVLTSPGAGVVTEVQRGERRSVRAIVVALEGEDEETTDALPAERIATLAREEIEERLLAGGLWVALRERPFHRVPLPGTAPSSIFVTATDTNPLAAKPEVVIQAHRDDFANGVAAVTRLTDGPVFVCRSAGAPIPVGDAHRVTVVDVSGPHPAGLVGTHIHRLDPVRPGSRVWHVGYQDVLAIGRQFVTGRPCVERVVALAGPSVRDPRLLRTRLGASVDDLVRDQLHAGACRVIAGSVLDGRQASDWGRHLGHRHLQVCAVPEPDTKGARRGGWTTARHGRQGPMVPAVDFEYVMPLDLLPAPLLRALVLGDDDAARDLGCLELDEEDLALCTYVCPSKLEYGPLLSRALARLEAGG